MKKEDNVTSNNQSGGTTAHTVNNIGTQINSSTHVAFYKTKKFKIVSVIFLISAIFAIINDGWGIFDRFRKDEVKMDKSASEIHNITSNNQSGGITAHTVNVNQQRMISSRTKVEQEKVGDNFLLRLILTQTSGIWDQGTYFKLEVKTSGPYESARIVKGFPGARFDVRISEDKEHGFYGYSSATAPIKDEPIVLEVISKEKISVSQIAVDPLER